MANRTPTKVDTSKSSTGRERITPAARFTPLRKKGGRPQADSKKKHREQYESCGAPPEDPLQAQEWAFEIITVAMMHTANDKNLSDLPRRRELRELARVLKDLVPGNRLSKAEPRLRGETLKNLGDDAGPVPQAAAPIAKKAKRGRPAKRA